jgi:4-amino-4-deoxy-L-arabinose transferase-like glycosyltransferase
VVGLLLLALAVRLGAVTWAGWTSVQFGDGPAYLFAARELVRTGHYPVSTEPLYFRAPGYPVFLVAATLGRPDRIAAAKAANAVLGALAVFVLAAISLRIFRRRLLAIATGVAAAVHPGLVSLGRDVASEPLFLLLLLCAGFLLLAAADRPSSNLAAAAGVLTGCAALTRPSALALIPLLAAPLLDRRYPLRARAHLASSALLGLCIALAPWTLRNAVVFHEFVPVNDAAGSNFYQGNSDWTVRFYQLRSRDEYLAWSRAMFADLERRTAELTASGVTSPRERSRRFVAQAFAERSGDPGGWARLMLRKVWDFVRPYPNPLFWPLPVVVAIGAVGAAISLLAIAGLAHAQRRGVRAFLLAFLGITLAAHVALIVVWRYRIPYWDPVLLLYAAPGGARLLGL